MTARVRVAGLVLMGLLGLVLLTQGAPVDLLLIGVVLTGLFAGSSWGGAVGLAYGAAQDLLGGTFPGLHLVVKTLTGLVAGTAEKRFFRDNPLLPALGLFWATVFKYLAYGAGGLLAGWGRGLWPPESIWVEAVVNTAVGMFICWLFCSRARRR